VSSVLSAGAPEAEVSQRGNGTALLRGLTRSAGYTPPEKPHELDTLKLLTTPQQIEVITDAMLGEEGDHFIELID